MTSAVVSISSVVLSVIGSLLGVYLGARLGIQHQASMLKAADSREDRRLREAAYVDLLAAYRRYRAFVATEAGEVKVVGATPQGGGVAVVNGVGEYEQAIQEATARVHLLEGEASPIVQAVTRIYRTAREVAIARADCGRGDVPYPVMEAARQAEIDFVRVAHAELQRRRSI